jgi:hypothetical protein
VGVIKALFERTSPQVIAQQFRSADSFNGMRRHLLGGIYVVEATKDGVVEYWAAATLQENAVSAVANQLGPGWTVTLTEQRLTSQRLSILKMLPNTGRKL